MIAEISTAFISCPGWVQGTVMGEDFKGNHLQFVEDIDEDMEDLIIEVMAEADTKVGEGAFRGDVIHRYACIGSVSPASIFIMK